MIKFSFVLPEWLHWLMPKRMREDHDQRIQLNGKASTSYLGGIFTATSEIKHDDR